MMGKGESREYASGECSIFGTIIRKLSIRLKIIDDGEKTVIIG